MVRGQDVAPEHGFGAAPGMRDQDGAADVAAMEAEFPEFAIWQEFAGGRGQYIARRMRRGVHPPTTVTPGRRAPPPPPRPPPRPPRRCGPPPPPPPGGPRARAAAPRVRFEDRSRSLLR